MFNVKKSVLASILLTGMAVSAGANATPNAFVTWSGDVPTTNASDDLIITGFDGDIEALTGSLEPDTQGVFQTDILTLEARTNDGDATAPIVGALTSANWSILNPTVTYNNVSNPAQSVDVYINGAVVVPGDVVSGVETISLQMGQTAELPEAEVSDTHVSATVTVMADVV
ncbi:hypothetical protein OTK49_14705 [Vibrio coralliirubri]|uniref:hypothetical protein n=1 Tax=Vibrio coralliirubri TaxID=1516159 RepID=UPI002284196C|nr:hypothetical protein [Vibrio coralliirubri]MCY9863790.1 hypothetical protein [Vibrio coralliirubri]